MLRPFLLGIPFLVAGLQPLPVGAVERDVTRDFPLAPGGSFSLDSFHGDVLVSQGPAGQSRVSVKVRMAVYSDDEKAVEREFSAVNLQFHPEPQSVAVTCTDPRQTGTQFAWNQPLPLELYYIVAVPPSCRVSVKVRNGNLTINDLTGAVTTQTGRGTTFCRRIDGAIAAGSEAGMIIVSHCTGQVSAHTANGEIRVGTAGGGADLATANGDVELQHARGPVVLRAEAGNITLGFLTPLSSGAKVSTNGGRIDVTLDPSAACSLQASSVFGHVTVAGLPLKLTQGGSGQRRLTGTLNGGGPQLELHANGGDVRLRASAPAVKAGAETPAGG